MVSLATFDSTWAVKELRDRFDFQMSQAGPRGYQPKMWCYDSKHSDPCKFENICWRVPHSL